jgi:hypothetical protein
LAFLRRKASGPPLHLRSYQLVGRWDGSHIVLDRAGVSKQHATIHWVGSAWMLRDLGSRNGTLHNGVRVEPTQPRELRVGDEIAFGERDEVWIVGDVDPPGLLLVPAPGSDEPTIHVSMADAFRALPSSDDPQVTIMRRTDGTWCAELASGDVLDLLAGGNVALLDRHYEVALPVHTQETDEPEAPLIEHDEAKVQYELEVADDEEAASLTVFAAEWNRPRHLRECVPLYLLAHLVRHRHESNDGWIDIEAACKALALTREQLGVHVFRVRESLKELGLVQVGNVIERKKGWIRTGVEPSRIRVIRRGEET